MKRGNVGGGKFQVQGWSGLAGHTQNIGCERVNGTRDGFEQRGGKGGWPNSVTLRGLWCLREMGLGNQKRWHSQDGESGQKFWEEFSGWVNKPW